MKKLMPLWMLLAAYSMALLIVVLYRLGGPGEMALFMICVPLLFVWYWLQTESVGMLALLSANLAVSYAVASSLSTKLYYHHVSDDGMTLVVGDLLTFTGTALIIIIAVCLIIARAMKKRKNVVYELIMHDPEMSSKNYSEDFMIGFFRTRAMAEETATHYLRHVKGFCEYPCTYSITKKKIVDAQDEIPAEVYMVQGWDTNENMDEINIVESSCFASEAHANAELERMKIAQPRTEWIINRWRIDETHWQEGFECV